MRAVPMTKARAPQVATVFLDACVMPYGIPLNLLTYNGPQFFAMLFVASFNLRLPCRQAADDYCVSPTDKWKDRPIKH